MSPLQWGGGSNQFHLLGPEKPPEKVDLEMRGRVFQVEGIACAKAQRSERTTVFLQKEASATLEVGSSAECTRREVGRTGPCGLWTGQQREVKKDSGRMKGKVLQGFFCLWNSCHRPQLLPLSSSTPFHGYFPKRFQGHSRSLLHSQGSLHATVSSSVMSVDPGSRSSFPGPPEVFREQGPRVRCTW